MDITTGSGEKKSSPLRLCQKLIFSLKGQNFAKSAFFLQKKKIFQSSPKILVTIMTGQQKTALCHKVFVLTPLHGGRRGGRRGPFLAQKSPFSSYTHITPITHTTLKRMFFFNWPFRDIKISKPPYVPFSKMFELCHFLSLLDLPERIYM